MSDQDTYKMNPDPKTSKKLDESESRLVRLCIHERFSLAAEISEIKKRLAKLEKQHNELSAVKLAEKFETDRSVIYTQTERYHREQARRLDNDKAKS